MLLLRRCGDVFIGQCIPFLLVLAKAQPAVATTALEQSGAVQELFGSNLKLGLPSAQQAANLLLVQLYSQVRLSKPVSHASACKPSPDNHGTLSVIANCNNMSWICCTSNNMIHSSHAPNHPFGSMSSA